MLSITSFGGWRPDILQNSLPGQNISIVATESKPTMLLITLIVFKLSHLFGRLAKFKSSSHCDSDKLRTSSSNYHYCMLFQSISFHSIPLFYIPSYFIPFYSVNPNLFLFLRFMISTAACFCAPDKNISQYHSDGASNMPQLPPVNQRV